MNRICLALSLAFLMSMPSALLAHEGKTLELGVTELIGINEQVSADQYSASVSVNFGIKGEIVKVCLFATEDNTGVVFTPAGSLILFKADPAITAGDSTITNAETLKITSVMTFAATDFISDTSGNGAYNCQDVSEAYPVATMFITWRSATGETQWNSAANDDEQLEFNFLFKRD